MATFVKNILFAPSPSDRSSISSSSTLFLPLDEQSTSFLSKSHDTEDLHGTTLLHETRSSSSRIDPRIISDAIIGMSDGLTVPFALTAGLSTLGNTSVVIYGGVAELIAGSISMGLGGYLGAKSEDESYYARRSQTEKKILHDPCQVQKDVRNMFLGLDIPIPLAEQITECLANSQSERLLDFVMRFEHSLPEPPANRKLTCALTIALGYFMGGFVPLLPYFFVARDAVQLGLAWSAGVMVVTLFLFGYTKTAVVHGWRGWIRGRKAARGGIEMVFIGSAAAAAAMGLVHYFSRGEGT